MSLAENETQPLQLCIDVLHLEWACGSFVLEEIPEVDPPTRAGRARRRERRLVMRRSRRPSSLSRAVTLALENLEHRRLLSASDLDSSFGTGGFATQDLPGSGFDWALAATLDGAGNIVSVGTSDATSTAWMTRHNSSGVLDAGFDGDGMLDLGALGFEDAIGVAMSGSNIVVVGTTTVVDQDFIVARFTSSGSLDFVDTYDSGSGNDVAAAVAVRPGGAIVVAGTTDTGTQDFSVLQLDSAGVEDVTFGTSGWFVDIVPGTAEVATSIVLDGTAAIVGGSTSTFGGDYALIRLDSSGALDTAFDTDGRASADFGNVERLNAIALDGAWVYGVGAAGAAGGLVRFNAATGALDGAFAGTGQAVVPGTDDATGVGVDSTGGIYVTGPATGGTDISLSRYDATGSLDLGFNLTGQTTVTSTPFAFPSGLRVQSDDKVVVFGTNEDFLLVRFGDTGGGNSPPTVDPVAGPTAGVRQQPRSFTGSFNDVDLSDTHDVAWDFGDGNTIALHPATDAGALTPTHTYTSSGTFNVTFTVKDSDGNLVVSSVHSVTISSVLQVGANLFVGGTSGNNSIAVRDRINGLYRVKIDGVTIGEYSAAGTIFVYGGDGDDDLAIELDIPNPTEMYGGEGNDVIKGGSGMDVMFGNGGADKIKARGANDIAVGGPGEDTVAGGDGRDVLIGGLDADKIAGQDDSDILVSGRTSHDDSVASLQAILAEWTGPGTNTTKVNNIRNGGGLNGSTVLKANVTTFDDGAMDTLAGGSGTDWFIANVSGGGVLDKLTGLNSSDFVDDLDFILGP